MMRGFRSLAAGAVLAGAVLSMAVAQAPAPIPTQDLKQRAFEWVDHNGGRLIEVSDAVWEFAEVALEEHRSAELLARELEEAGFDVERGVAGLPTAFVARWGSGEPAIGILAEYDALPSLSQRRGETEKVALEPGGAGHGCGHNLYGTACLGAALALKTVMEEEGLAGTVILYGCPAEETVIGKVVMARAGLFDGLDAAITWHPGTSNQVTVVRSLAMNSFEVTFHGRTAHGAADPWNGRSALDAVELMNAGVNMMREHVRPSVRIHYVITEGGAAPNIVPDLATAWYYVRDTDREGVDEVYGRVLGAAEAAALATETELEVRFISGVHSELVNQAIAAAHQRNLELVGGPDFTEAEQEFARTIQRNLGIEPSGVSEEIVPLPEHPSGSRGSTDVAEVSWITPLAEFNVAFVPQGAPWHSWVVVSCSGSSLAHRAMLIAAKTLAATAIDLLTDPDLLAEARAEFESATESRPYVSPLDAARQR